MFRRHAIEQYPTTDYHMHCLPGIDDGSRSVEESAIMLKTSFDQGIRTVVATPHFYSGTESVSSFLEKREKAFESIKPVIPEGMTVLMGAEVLVRDHVSDMDLHPLCMEGTNRILLELPMKHQPRWMDSELESIIFGQELAPVFAHVDRYMEWYVPGAIMDLLGPYYDAIIQLNTPSFCQFSARKKLPFWLPPPFPILLGSDMHRSTGSRGQNMTAGYEKMMRSPARKMWEERWSIGEEIMKQELCQGGIR